MIKTAVLGGALAGLALPASASAQAPVPVPSVVVTAPSPLPAASAPEAAPVAASTLSSEDLTRDGAADVLRALDAQSPGVSLDSASGNPFQPSLYYRGFQAAPLQGTAQGLAVYVGGVRANQAFGDTVDWDLIPSVAIDKATLEAASPLYGLNALGGALDVRLKSGFSFQGGEAEVSGGSFGRVQGDGQWGARRGDLALYLAAASQHEDGWRDSQASDVQSLYGDVGWMRGADEAHLAVRLARSDLNGPGATPVQLLAADPAAQFTGPNRIRNGYAIASLSVRHALSAADSLEAIVYGDDLRQKVVNGNAPNDTPCGVDPGLLCADGGVSRTLGGEPIPAFLGPDPLSYAELDRQTTASAGYGAAVQLVDARRLAGRANRLTLGASFDGAQTDFSGESLVGGISTRRTFVGPGVVIDEPGANAPVRLRVRNAYAGLFAAEALDLTRRLTLTVSGRYNAAEIDLTDRGAGGLGGRHHYQRLNPQAGLAYKAAPWLTLFGDYAEANRAPTPAELSCAGPADACSLANFFVGDPELKPVVSRTLEAGLRGDAAVGPGARLRYSLSLYRSDLLDDIAFVNSAVLNRAFFANIGRTRRQGLDAAVSLEDVPWRAWASFSHVEATYRSGFVEAGGRNPAAGADGQLVIRPGDGLPGVPQNQFKAGVSFTAGDGWTLGASLEGRDGAYPFGDEANRTPKLPGYVVAALNAAFQVSPGLQLFGRIENAGDVRAYSYGTFSPTAAVRLVQAPGASNPRSLSPIAPIGVFAGLRARF